MDLATFNSIHAGGPGSGRYPKGSGHSGAKTVPTSPNPLMVAEYHGTTDNVLREIAQTGLVPKASAGNDEWARKNDELDTTRWDQKHGAPSVYMTQHSGIAAWYADNAESLRPGSTSVVVKLQFPADWAQQNLVRDEVSADSDDAFRFPGTITPDHIAGFYRPGDTKLHQLDELTTQPSGTLLKKDLRRGKDKFNLDPMVTDLTQPHKAGLPIGYSAIFGASKTVTFYTVISTHPTLKVHAYSPDEPRDNKGEWTSDGDHDESTTPYTMPNDAVNLSKPTLQRLADTIAKEMNYSVAKTDISDEKKLTEDGAEIYGEYQSSTHNVTLYQPNLADQKLPQVVQVIAHEMTHDMMHTFADKAIAQHKAAEDALKSMGAITDEVTGPSATDVTREIDEHPETYPVAEVYQKYAGDPSTVSKMYTAAGKFTPYSRMVYNKAMWGNMNMWGALNETMAEVGAMRYAKSHGDRTASKIPTILNRAYDDIFKAAYPDRPVPAGGARPPRTKSVAASGDEPMRLPMGNGMVKILWPNGDNMIVGTRKVKAGGPGSGRYPAGSHGHDLTSKIANAQKAAEEHRSAEQTHLDIAHDYSHEPYHQNLYEKNMEMADKHGHTAHHFEYAKEAYQMGDEDEGDKSFQKGMDERAKNGLYVYARAVKAGGPGSGRYPKGSSGNGLGRQGTGHTFVSPNETSLSLEDAKAALNSPEQKKFERESKQLGESVAGRGHAQVEPVLGTWATGAENSVHMHLDSTDKEKQEYVAAKAGADHNQMSSLVFRMDKNGPHSLYVVNSKGDPDTLNKSIGDAGIEFRSVNNNPSGGSKAYIYDSDNSLGDKVKKLGADNGYKTTVAHGTGKFIGSFEDREEGVRLQREVADRYELKHQKQAQIRGQAGAVDAAGGDAGADGGGLSQRDSVSSVHGRARSADKIQVPFILRAEARLASHMLPGWFRIAGGETQAEVMSNYSIAASTAKRRAADNAESDVYVFDHRGDPILAVRGCRVSFERRPA